MFAEWHHNNGGKCHHPPKNVHPARVDIPVVNQEVFVVNQVYERICKGVNSICPHLEEEALSVPRRVLSDAQQTVST